MCPATKVGRPGSRGEPAKTRAAILKSALQEFAREGIAGARTDEIARRAGVNKALLYYYFRDKEGLYTAALDPRVKGVVSIAGFTPMRSDAAARGTGGVARYSHESGLIPKLGFFVGREDRIPYDFDDLIAAIAPRPMLVVEPRFDRDATPADVHTAVDQAKRIYGLYGAAEKLAIREPWDYNRLPERTQDEIVKWMGATLR